MRTKQHAVFAALPDAQFSPMFFMPDAQLRRMNVEGFDYAVLDETHLLPFQKATIAEARSIEHWMRIGFTRAQAKLITFGERYGLTDTIRAALRKDGIEITK